MLYVGVDLHKKSISVCGMNRDRQVLETRRLLCLEEHRIVETFRTFREVYGGVELVVEATASYEWFLALVEPVVACQADGAECHVRSGRSRDRP